MYEIGMAYARRLWPSPDCHQAGRGCAAPRPRRAAGDDADVSVSNLYGKSWKSYPESRWPRLPWSAAPRDRRRPPARTGRRRPGDREGAYTATGSAVGAVDDARAVAAALTGAGWRVREPRTSTRPALPARSPPSPPRSSRASRPSVYFSGLAAKAPSARAARVENFLLPVDADVPAREALPAAAVPLSDLLAALTRAGRAPRWSSSTRPGPIRWSRAGRRRWPGRADHRRSRQRLCRLSRRLRPDGPRSLFGPELATAIRDGSGSVNDLFLGLSTRIDQATGGAQVPWSSGSGVSSRLAIRRNVLPAAAGGASPAPSTTRPSPAEPRPASPKPPARSTIQP